MAVLNAPTLFGNAVTVQAFRNGVPKFCIPKQQLAKGEGSKIVAEAFRGFSIPVKRTETSLVASRNVLHREVNAPGAEISTLRDHSFVADLVWEDGNPLVAERDIGAVQAALDTHSVVVLRNPQLTLGEHIALTKLLGEPEVVTDMRNHHPDSLEVLVVNNVGRTPVIGNVCWHSDRSFLPRPTRYTTLHGIVVGTGDTLFSDMVGAYAEAPAAMKFAMQGAMGVHTYDKTARLRAKVHNKEVEEYASRYPPVRHPLVRSCCHDNQTPRDTPALLISELCLARLEYEDGAAVPGLTPDMLLEHATQARFVYRHRWVQGDVVIWDNRRVVHKVDHLPVGVPRLMHRTTTADDAPVAALTSRLQSPAANPALSLSARRSSTLPQNVN